MVHHSMYTRSRSETLTSFMTEMRIDTKERQLVGGSYRLLTKKSKKLLKMLRNDGITVDTLNALLDWSTHVQFVLDNTTEFLGRFDQRRDNTLDLDWMGSCRLPESAADELEECIIAQRKAHAEFRRQEDASKRVHSEIKTLHSVLMEVRESAAFAAAAAA